MARGEICALIVDNGRKVNAQFVLLSENLYRRRVPQSFLNSQQNLSIGSLWAMFHKSLRKQQIAFPASVLELVDASQYARAKTERVSSKGSVGVRP